MLGLAVLLPVTLGSQWWLEHRTLAQEGTIPPATPLVSGTTTELADSQWEFLGALADEEPQSGVRLVEAGFLVTPADDVAGERLYSYCHFRAVDAEDRTWNQAAGLPEQPEDAGNAQSGSCSSPDFAPISGGTEQLLVTSFEVPEDAVDGLQFEVEVATHEPDVDHDPDEDLDELFADPDALLEHDPEADDNPPRPVGATFEYREFEAPEGY